MVPDTFVSPQQWFLTPLFLLTTLFLPTAQIKAIAVAGRKEDYKLRTVIENLILSDLFSKR